jgi:hypothetical protein
MRKVLITFLLASAAAAPALADPADSSDRQAARAERLQAHEERSQASDKPAAGIDRLPAVHLEHSAPDAAARAQLRSPDRAVRLEQAHAGVTDVKIRDVRIPDPDIAKSERVARQDAAQADRAADREDRVEQREQRIDQRHDQVANQAPHPVTPRTPPPVSDTPKPGTQPPPQTTERPSPAPKWSTNWRDNHKYDWHNWRRHHHSWFHLGFYYDPFGWGYSPYGIGWRMWPSYYGDRYWISDPWQYRLPYAPAGYQWIRYYDDALLVDTWSGEVVDVIYNFFW